MMGGSVMMQATLSAMHLLPRQNFRYLSAAVLQTDGVAEVIPLKRRPTR